MRTQRLFLGAGLLVVAGGLGLMVLHRLGSEPGGPEGWLAAVGLGAPFVAAGLLGVLGAIDHRPSLLLAGGLATVPMSIISFVALPLLLPAVVLLVAALLPDAPPAPGPMPGPDTMPGHGTMPGPTPTRAVTTAGGPPAGLAAGTITAVTLVATLAYLVFHQDPAAWSAAGTAYSSSNIVTGTEALLSIGVAALVVAASTALIMANRKAARSRGFVRIG